MPCHALNIVLDLGTTWPVTEARENSNHQRQHWDREGAAGTIRSSIMLRKSDQAQDKLELYQMV